MMRPVLFAALALLLGGCATKYPYTLDLMPAPFVYELGVYEPFADPDAVINAPYSGILYATDRRPATADDREPRYTSDRDLAVHVGSVSPLLGEGDLSWDDVRLVALDPERDAGSWKLTVGEVDEFGVLASSVPRLLVEPSRFSAAELAGAEELARQVDLRLAGSGSNDVIIYVHGFKVVFESPVLVANELWYFLGYQGAFMTYSWAATPSGLAYFKDLETTQFSARGLRKLITYLSENTNVENIHLIGFSAGARLVMHTMGQLTLARIGAEFAGMDLPAGERLTKLGQVILVGGDFDRQMFGGFVEDGMLDLAERMVIYLSGTDTALWASSKIFGWTRLGQVWESGDVRPAVVQFLDQQPRLQFIDVTDVDPTFVNSGHDYFKNSRTVSSDVLMSLRYGLSPAERGLVLDRERMIWTFPDDYIERLRRAVLRVEPTPVPPASPISYSAPDSREE